MGDAGDGGLGDLGDNGLGVAGDNGQWDAGDRGEDSLEEVSSGEMEEYNKISDNEIWDQVQWLTYSTMQARHTWYLYSKHK